jgi:glycosyltransferase involved in cell wall biosynthesis
MDNPRRHQQLAHAAYQAALDPDYTWDAIAERFDDLFAELTRGTAGICQH